MKLLSWPSAALAGATLIVLSVAIPGSDPSDAAGELHLSASLGSEMGAEGAFHLELEVDPGAAVEEVAVFMADEHAATLGAPVEGVEGSWTVPGHLYAEGCHEVGVEVVLALGAAAVPADTVSAKMKKIKSKKGKSPTDKSKKMKKVRHATATVPAGVTMATLRLNTQVCAPAPARECEEPVLDLPL